MKSGTGTEFLDVKGDKTTGHGEFLENMENGDKNYYRYEFTGTSKDGAFESGSNKWSMTEGGGKMKGGKASGTCTAKGNADGSTSFDCMGTYTPAAKSSCKEMPVGPFLFSGKGTFRFMMISARSQDSSKIAC